METQKKISDAIKGIITTMMERVMKNVLEKDPFIPEVHKAKKRLLLVSTSAIPATYIRLASCPCPL